MNTKYNLAAQYFFCHSVVVTMVTPPYKISIALLLLSYSSYLVKLPLYFCIAIYMAENKSITMSNLFQYRAAVSVDTFWRGYTSAVQCSNYAGKV